VRNLECSGTFTLVNKDRGDTEILTLLKRYLTVNPKSRNAGRGLLLLHQLHKAGAKDAEFTEECKNFFETHKANRSCFEDLRPFLTDLTAQQQETLQKHVTFAASTEEAPISGEEVG
jgi:hypothetical protein